MIMKKVLLVLAMFVVLVTLTSCNTVKGVGQDIESVGDAMSDAVQ